MVPFDEQFLLLTFICCVFVTILFLIAYLYLARNRETQGPRITDVRYPHAPAHEAARPPPSEEALNHSRHRQAEIFRQRLDDIQLDYASGTVSQETYRRLDGEYRAALKRLEDNVGSDEQVSHGPEIVS